MHTEKKTKILDRIDSYSAHAKKDIRMADIVPSIENEDFKSIVRNMFVVLMYSYIEGTIKNIANIYIDFIRTARHGNLNAHFSFLIHDENKPLKILKSLTNRKYDNIIDTEDNLKFCVLLKILFILNVPSQKYFKFKTQLDKLVENRNALAHGDLKIYNDDIKITDEYISSVKDMTSQLIDMFCDDIRDCIDKDAHFLNTKI